jgi:hypothetical protein
MAMGAYGASISIYSHFIARGRELEFPKNTAMDVVIGTRASTLSPDVPKPGDAKIERQSSHYLPSRRANSVGRRDIGWKLAGMTFKS